MLNKIKRNNGITLISLIVTIIVLLILAGITLTAVTGENGLIKKAANAKEESEKNGAKEQIETIILTCLDKKGDIDSNKLEEELNKLGGTISNPGNYPSYVELNGYQFEIDEEGSVTDSISNVIEAEVIASGRIYLLKKSGEYVFSDTNETNVDEWGYIKYNKDNETIIASGVKAISYDGSMYLTTNNELCDPWNNVIIADRVKSFTSHYYLTMDNELYDMIKEEKIAENVKDYNYKYYLTNDNKLYNSDTNNKVLEGVKLFNDNYYVSLTNALYKISNGEKIADNVKKFDNSAYLTTDNELYDISTKEKILENIKDFNNVYYITSDNKKHYFNYFYEELEDVIRVEEYWYEKENGDIYYRYILSH